MYEIFKSYLKSKVQVNEEQVRQAFKLLSPMYVKSGGKLLKQGDICSHDIFVAKGCLRSYIVDDSGVEHIIEFAPENCWIADQHSFLKKVPAIFTIDAVEDSELLLVDRDFTDKMMKMIPGIWEMVYDLLQDRIRALQKRIITHLNATAEERYLDFQKDYPTLINRIPQHMIASYIGITPQSLSRVRHQMGLTN